MSKRTIGIFIVIFQLAGATLGGLLVYAKDHPDSGLHQTFTKAGFHLK
jgi:hypothetical protein